MTNTDPVDERIDPTAPLSTLRQYQPRSVKVALPIVFLAMLTTGYLVSRGLSAVLGPTQALAAGSIALLSTVASMSFIATNVFMSMRALARQVCAALGLMVLSVIAGIGVVMVAVPTSRLDRPLGITLAALGIVALVVLRMRAGRRR